MLIEHPHRKPIPASPSTYGGFRFWEMTMLTRAIPTNNPILSYHGRFGNSPVMVEEVVFEAPVTINPPCESAGGSSLLVALLGFGAALLPFLPRKTRRKR